MKLLFLLIGLVAGAAIGVIWAARPAPPSPFTPSPISPAPEKTGWNWPDSLDAVRAAPHNHKILFENDKIRILEVILEPHEYEKLHTHSHPSVMFGGDDDTSSIDIVYYAYSYDPVTHKYFAKDSIRQHHGGQTNQPDTGYYMKPEGPHRIKNLGNHKMVVYRVEMK
jgi:hypothetical protein